MIPTTLETSLLPRNNPFGVVTLRRPRWFQRKVPMLDTIAGWQRVWLFDWVCHRREDDQDSYWIVPPDTFERLYSPVSAELSRF